MTIDVVSLQILVSFIFFTLCAAALTSGWLTSPFFENDRKCMISWNNKLSTLASCALCSGFWIGLATEWAFMPYLGPVLYIGLALGSAVISWTIYSIALMCAWAGAAIKLNYEREQ